MLRPLGNGSDRALAVAIATEVCRHAVALDALIDAHTREPLAHDLKVRQALRIALVQALAMRVPDHAAIATVLPLVSGGPRRLLHGVFSAVLRSGARLPAVPPLPPAVERRWEHSWGREETHRIAAALAAPPPLDLTLRDPASTAEWAERLEGTSLAPGHLRLDRGRAVHGLPGYGEGAWWVQDLAASIPARLLGRGGGRRVIDIGAAPGGKTMQLAAAGWEVVALDASARRAERLRDNLARVQLGAEVVVGDGRDLSGHAAYDAALLDAPCSATGIARRHPDVLHRIEDRDIADRASLQAQMLESAGNAVREGGQIVYATCSLEPAEGEGQIAAFLGRRPDWRIDPVSENELPTGLLPTAVGTVRTLPSQLAEAGGLDGFFIARLVRGV